MVVQYAAVRQILYIFCLYRLLVEEYHHGRQRGLIFYKLATLRATAHMCCCCCYYYCYY